jgi:hypothetical protein
MPKSSLMLNWLLTTKGFSPPDQTKQIQNPQPRGWGFLLSGETVEFRMFRLEITHKFEIVTFPPCESLQKYG